MKKALVLGAGLLLAVAGGAAIWDVVHRSTPPDINVAGGTILVYEIDRSDPDTEVRTAGLEKETLAAFQRRFVAAKLTHVTAAYRDRNRIEFRIPRTEDHDRDVAAVKELVLRAGHLEFRVLANEEDDFEGMREARTLIERGATDPAVGAELERRQREGLPPPLPLAPGGGPKHYTIRLPGGVIAVAYAWVELGPQMRHSLRLNRGTGRPDARQKAVQEYARARLGRAFTVPDPDGRAGGKLLHGALFCSRECKDRHLEEKVRHQKGVDYFVLVRGPEIDRATGKEGEVLTGASLVEAAADVDGRPLVKIRFNEKGGERMARLTASNLPSLRGDVRIERHLALVLDGQVLAAPTIRSEIRQAAQITGAFTQAETERLAAILRAGALPVRLRPVPVAEEVVRPRQAGGN